MRVPRALADPSDEGRVVVTPLTDLDVEVASYVGAAGATPHREGQDVGVVAAREDRDDRRVDGHERGLSLEEVPRDRTPE